MKTLTVVSESWPIDGSFAISRGSKTSADVVTVTITDESNNGERITGRGECVPYARYGETIESVIAQIKTQQALISSTAKSSELRVSLQSMLPSGAARNAVDCALWDLEARQTGSRVWQLAGIELSLIHI